jgi:hypothetical protein
VNPGARPAKEIGGAAAFCITTDTGANAVARAGLYARVFTIRKGQATDNQLIQLREFSQNQHWAVTREYEDHESGGKADRTEFRVMLLDAAARKFDVLLFWSLDRLTREGALATLKYSSVQMSGCCSLPRRNPMRFNKGVTDSGVVDFAEYYVRGKNQAFRL